MEKENKLIQCIFDSNMRELVKHANSLEIKKEDIIQFFKLRDQIYLIYYK